MKLDIPFFDGHLHIEDYLDWEKSVENFSDYMYIVPEKKVKYVACRLKEALALGGNRCCKPEGGKDTAASTLGQR